MPVLIQIKSGARAGKEYPFDDRFDRIEIGRNPERCQLLFSDNDSSVGREHCALVRHLGRYSLEINRTDVVLLDEKRVRFNLDELPPECELRLGANGPIISVKSWLAGSEVSTTGTDSQPGIGTMIAQDEEELKQSQQTVKKSAREAKHDRHVVWFVAAVLSLVVVGVIWLTWRPESGLQMAKAVLAARPSVYVVVVQDGNKSPTPWGTAWVVCKKRGLLATNAHVYLDFKEKKLAKKLPAGSRLAVHAPVAGGEVLPIDMNHIQIHPGYAAWQEFVNEFPPLGKTVAACDVALMPVENPESLAPALPLADTKSLNELKPGDPIGLVGYPTENLPLPFTNVHDPTPGVQLGNLVRMTDYFGANNVPFAERLLVTHSAPSAGGTSGSPILNRRGEVIAVHSDASYISFGPSDDQRIPIATMTNSGQRIDLVKQLLSNTADKVLVLYKRQWEEAIAKPARTKPAEEYARAQLGDSCDNNGLQTKFLFIPSGNFTMGSPQGEKGRSDDENQVAVTLSKGFWLGQNEVTQAQWKSVMSTAPWSGHLSDAKKYVQEGAQDPATYVSWNEAVKFCERLTEQEHAAGRLRPNWQYTLPTEAQWEDACRAGSQSRFSFGDDDSQLSDYAWWGGLGGQGDANTEQYAHEVRQKMPNRNQLNDMHGNVWEWCLNWYAKELAGGTDPEGPAQGSERVIRGGGWDNAAGECRSASRRRDAPDYRSYDVGFRLAAVPSSK
jgi:formylglycine-generating enzyme required for sulfatase activity